MDDLDPARWRHSHHFGVDTARAERRTRAVIVITVAMMVVEIAAGLAFHSMALLADGWHMSTHAAAFLITALAYRASRRYADDPRYSFGTGKMGVLGGFASAIILLVIALLMAGESVQRLLAPMPIEFDAAMAVAGLGLLVNLVCALLLKDEHAHHGAHGHGGHHDHGGPASAHGPDLNRRAAYVHVLADAFTSVTALVALFAGKYFGWFWLDACMGVVGSAVIAVWAYGLIQQTSGILLDGTPDSSDLPQEIRRAVESSGDAAVCDLHVWQIASGQFAAIVSIVARHPQPPDAYRALWQEHEELVHVTVEVRPSSDPAPA